MMIRIEERRISKRDPKRKKERPWYVPNGKIWYVPRYWIHPTPDQTYTQWKQQQNSKEY